MLNSELGNSNMEFNQRKEKYIEKVKSNPILTSIVNNTAGTENSELLLNPSDFNELKIAEKLFPLWEEIYALATSDEIVPDIENNVVVKMLIESVNTLKENKKVNIKSYDYDEINKLARFNYDTVVLMHVNQEELYKYIGDKCGFDVDDISDIKKLNTYMGLASLLLTKLKNGNLFNENLKSLNEEDFKILSGYVSEFHKIYQEGMENKQSKQKSKY